MKLRLLRGIIVAVLVILALVLALPFLIGLVTGLLIKGQSLKWVKPIIQDMRFQQLQRKRP